jgi:hypothetical protein
MRRRVGSARARKASSLGLGTSRRHQFGKLFKHSMAISAQFVGIESTWPAALANPGKAIMKKRDPCAGRRRHERDDETTGVDPVPALLHPRKHEAAFGDQFEHRPTDPRYAPPTRRSISNSGPSHRRRDSWVVNHLQTALGGAWMSTDRTTSGMTAASNALPIGNIYPRVKR